MARGRNRRTRPARSRRGARPSSTRRLGKINRLPAMPPSLDLGANYFTAWIRTQTGIKTTTKYWVNLWNMSEMLTTEYKHLMSIYAEYRLKRVNVWFIPAVSITSTGVYSMANYDNGSNYELTPGLIDVTSAPGSQTAKVYQPLKGVWHRSEPKDKNWISSNDDYHPFATAIATSASSLEGVLIMDLHISFRGMKQADAIDVSSENFSRIRDHVLQHQRGVLSPFEMLTVVE